MKCPRNFHLQQLWKAKHTANLEIYLGKIRFLLVQILQPSAWRLFAVSQTVLQISKSSQLSNWLPICVNFTWVRPPLRTWATDLLSRAKTFQESLLRFTSVLGHQTQQPLFKAHSSNSRTLNFALVLYFFYRMPHLNHDFCKKSEEEIVFSTLVWTCCEARRSPLTSLGKFQHFEPWHWNFPTFSHGVFMPGHLWIVQWDDFQELWQCVPHGREHRCSKTARKKFWFCCIFSPCRLANQMHSISSTPSFPLHKILSDLSMWLTEKAWDIWVCFQNSTNKFPGPQDERKAFSSSHDLMSKLQGCHVFVA